MTKYYRTLILLEVLSNEEPGDNLEHIIDGCTNGPYSGDTLINETKEVSEAHMRELLINQRSDPEFLIPPKEDGQLPSRLVGQLLDYANDRKTIVHDTRAPTGE